MAHCLTDIDSLPTPSRDDLGCLVTPYCHLSQATNLLLGYWEKLYQERGRLPGRSQFNPSKVRSNLRGIWLVDCLRPTSGNCRNGHPLFRCRLYAAGLVDLFGTDLTGLMLHEADCGFADSATEHDFMAIMSDKRPRFWRGAVAMTMPTSPHAVEVLMLPLAEDGNTVDMLLCHALPLTRAQLESF